MNRRFASVALFSAILGFNFFMYFTDSRSTYFDMVLFAITLLGLLAALTKPVPRRLFLFLAPLGALLTIYAAWIPISNDPQALIHFAGGMAGLAVFTFAFQNADDIISSRWCHIFMAIIMVPIVFTTVHQISLLPDFSSRLVDVGKSQIQGVDINRVFGIYPKNWFNSAFAYHLILATVMLGARRTPSVQIWIWMGSLAIISAVAYHFSHRSIHILAAVAMAIFAITAFSRNFMLSFKFIFPFVFMMALFTLVTTHTGSGFISLQDLNEIFIEYTNRRATSGREIIWPLILQALDGRAAFGLGGHFTFYNIFGVNWSSHSLFMQVFMQTGYIGLMLTAGWLLGIWALITGGPYGRLQGAGVALFILIAGHSALDVFLLQNSIILAIPCWLALGLICGLLHNRRTAPRPRTQRNPPFHGEAQHPISPRRPVWGGRIRRRTDPGRRGSTPADAGAGRIR